MAKQPSLKLTEQIEEISRTFLVNEEKFKNISLDQETLKNKVNLLDNRVQQVEIKIENNSIRLGSYERNWSTVFDLIWKCLLMIVAGYILWALGLQADLAFPPS